MNVAVRDDQDEVPIRGARCGGETRRPLVAEELEDRRADGSVALDGEMDEPLGAGLPGQLDEPIDLGARGARHARRCKAHDATAGFGRLVEDAEAAAGSDLAQVVQLEAVADIGLVGAEPVECLAVRKARERDLAKFSFRDDRAADLDRHRLDERHDVIGRHEAHLEVELGEFRTAIGAAVLVAHAVGDLEVAVHPGDHQQLLELLRALRQRVDVARLLARRDDEVARPLGRRLDQQRRLDLDETVRMVDLGDGSQQLRAEHESIAHRFATHIEVAVAEAQSLLDRGIQVVDREGRLLRAREDVNRSRAQLDRAGGELRVLRPGEPVRDRAVDRDDVLGAERRGDGVGLEGGLGIDDDLGDAVAIAQVQEYQVAQVAATMDPAGEARFRTGI